MSNLDFAREIIKQCAEYDELGRDVGGVTLSTINPNDGFVYALADQLAERDNFIEGVK